MIGAAPREQSLANAKSLGDFFYLGEVVGKIVYHLPRAPRSDHWLTLNRSGTFYYPQLARN
jgi:hypothetical protein